MNFNGEKIKTGIIGLDKLLFGGLCLQTPESSKITKPLSIAIYGDKGTSKALLAMQLLHGITVSLRKYEFIEKEIIKEGKEEKTIIKKVNLLSPIYFTSEMKKENVSDMLLDMLLSKCINKIVENNAKGRRDWTGCKFANFAFNTNNQSIGASIMLEKLDYYLGEEMLIYDTHTNALHIAHPLNQHHRKSSEDSPLFFRHYDSIGEYAKKVSEQTWIGEEYEAMAGNFFDIRIITLKNENKELSIADQKDINNNPLSDSCDTNDCKHNACNEITKIPCVVINELKSYTSNDKTDLKINYQQSHLSDAIKKICEDSFVNIFLVDGSPKDINMSFDMLIELRKNEDKDTHYLFNQLSIKKSSIQDTAIGWHIFKKRDYGIEVYPSSHVILQKRRHMPKDLLMSQKSILAKSFQKFIDDSESNVSLQNLGDFEKNQSTPFQMNTSLMDMLKDFDDSRQKESAVDILKTILVPSPLDDRKGECTALIGQPNTFKRFLTHSGTFNACCEGVHTLNILLDKDDQIMGRRMICPAYMCKRAGKFSNELIRNCIKCYNFIHYSNIRMGCISSDEFFYYLIKQIEISRARASEKNDIRRIVIDDLQKLEYCFPILHNDPLFLTTLISICKDYNIDLFMLCDKSSTIVSALRAQSDNVICTERISEDGLIIYIERYAGYSSPSRIWKCEVENMNDLFYCDTINSKRHFNINDRHIYSKVEYTMNNYWNNK